MQHSCYHHQHTLDITSGVKSIAKSDIFRFGHILFFFYFFQDIWAVTGEVNKKLLVFMATGEIKTVDDSTCSILDLILILHIDPYINLFKFAENAHLERNLVLSFPLIIFLKYTLYLFLHDYTLIFNFSLYFQIKNLNTLIKTWLLH